MFYHKLFSVSLSASALMLALASAHAQDHNPEFAPGKETRINHPGMCGHFLGYLPTDYTIDPKWSAIFFYHGMNGNSTTDPIQMVTSGKGYIVVGMDYGSKAYHDYPNYNRAGPENNHLLAIMKKLDQSLNIDRSMIFMAGVSKGGYSTSVLGETMLDDLAGLALLAAGRTARDKQPPNFKKIRAKPIFIGVGANDIGTRPGAVKAAENYRRWGDNVNSKYGRTWDMPWIGLARFCATGYSSTAHCATVKNDWTKPSPCRKQENCPGL
jgi:poly(3-hydroxybutyrate) depolymerase